MVHHNILTLSPYTLFLSPHPSPTPSFIASPFSPYSFLHCFIASPFPYSFLHCLTLLPSAPSFTVTSSSPYSFLHCLIASPFPYSFLHCLTLLPLLLSSLPHPPPLLLPLLLHPPPTPSFIASPSSFLHYFINSPSSPYSFLYFLPLPLLLPSLPHPPPPSPFFIASLILEPA